MFLVTYSKELLYLTLAICVLWLTFFLTWLIYYLVAAARQLHKGVMAVKEQVDEVASIIRKVKLAFEIPTSIIGLVVEGFKKVAEMGKDAMADCKPEPKTANRKVA